MPSTSIVQALTDKLQTHKDNQFTGVVHVSVRKKAQWSIYFHMGRIVWAHACMHPTRRWYRQVAKHCPHLLEGFAHSYAEFHYSKLVVKVREGNLNRINMAKAVEDYLSEILFDIIHQGTLRALQSKPGLVLTDVEKRYASSMFLIVRSEQAWQQTLYDWQAWQQAELVKCSPNLAPKIGDAEELKRRTSAPVYEHLTSIIDGEHSFRDLAVKLNQPLLPLTRRIVPYVRQGLMGLVRLEDLASPTASAERTDSTSALPSARPVGARQTIGLDHLLSAQSQEASERASLQRPTSYRAATSEVLSSKVLSSQALSPQAVSKAQPSAAQQSQRNQRFPARPAKPTRDAPLVIYIDDSPRDSRTLGSILQDAGFRFRSIQESTHALPLLIEHKPQLIFLDLVMPVANGYEICSQVRRVSLFKDIPIVIVTSNNSLADRVHAKMVGASGFLSKPINRDKVLRTVNKLLNTQKQLASSASSQEISPAASGADKQPSSQAANNLSA